jgi:Mg-chelatase subunit ChlD
VNENLEQQMLCLDKFYDREIDNNISFSGCLFPDDIEKYIEISKKSMDFAANDSSKLRLSAEKIHSNYNQILILSQELNRVESQNQISLLMLQIENAYNLNKEYTLELYDLLNTIYDKLIQEKAEDRFRIAEKTARNCVIFQTRIFQHWHYNFVENVQTEAFPFDFMIQNTNETDFAFWDYDKNSDLSGISHKVYTQIFQTILNDFQQKKRNYIDNYTPKTAQNDIFSNNAFLDLFSFTNNKIIVDFNTFAGQADEQKLPVMRIPKIAPAFSVNNSENLKPEADQKYSRIENRQLHSLVQDSCITENEVMALNHFVEFLNAETVFMNFLTDNIFNLNRKFNDFSETQATNETTDFFSNFDFFPRSSFEKAMTDCRLLPFEYRKSLNRQIKALYILSTECRQIAQKLNDLIVSPNIVKQEEISIILLFKRYETLILEYNTQKDSVFRDIKYVYDTYPVSEKNTEINKNEEGLNRLCNADLKLLERLKEAVLQNEEKPQFDLSFRKQLKDSVKYSFEASFGFSYEQRNHISQMFSNSDIWAEKIKKIQKIPSVSEYRLFTETYNKIILNYNEFAESGLNIRKTENRQFLLKNILQATLFKFAPPNIILQKKHEKTMDGYAPDNLVLLLDVSQSMNSSEKLPLLKQSFENLLPILRAQDLISIVVYSGTASVILPPTSCFDKAKILNAISTLKSGGGTYFGQGIRKAYQVADAGFIPNGNNRIIVASDGEFIVDEAIKNLVSQNAEKGILLSIFQYGKDAKKIKKLDDLSRLGKGNYELINELNSDDALLKEAKALEEKGF